jgi:hypothetical protein
MVKVESQPSVGSTNRGANRDDLRQSNLSNLLKLVYRNQTISRADLTTMTGLNRSTISDLVGELVSLKLVTEKESAQVGRVGRPSSNVTIAENIFAITVVPRSHSTLVAAVSMSGRVAARVRIATVIQPSPEEVLDAVEEGLAQIRKQLKKSDRIVGVSVAISGQVDVRNNSIRICSFLKWNEVPFGSLLSERLGLPV